MATLKERFIAALLKRGETEIKRTSIYVVFTCSKIPTATDGLRYYIGRSGALRIGHTRTSSFVVGLRHRNELLELVP